MRTASALSTMRGRRLSAGATLLALILAEAATSATEPSTAHAKRKGSGNPSAPTARDTRPTSQSPSAEKETGAKQAPPRRLVTVGGGRITLDVRQWPLIGKPDAKHVLVEMFDYTCPYCQATHQTLRGAIEHFGDDLAIVALPVPLNAACNRSIQSTAAQHAEACEIARIAVAVWRVDRKRFPQFHSWLFAPAQRRTAAEARRQAAELVGGKAFEEELSRPYAGQYIARHVELYQRIGSGSLPKLLFPKTTVSGSVESSSTLVDMIGREFSASP